MYVPGKLIYVAVYSKNAKIHFDVNTYLLFLNYIKCQEMNLQRDAEKFLFFCTETTYLQLKVLRVLLLHPSWLAEMLLYIFVWNTKPKFKKPCRPAEKE